MMMNNNGGGGMPFQTQAQQAAQIMMRGNSNEFSASKGGTQTGPFRTEDKSTMHNGRKVFTAGNNSKGSLPPTHPKGFGSSSTIQS